MSTKMCTFTGKMFDIFDPRPEDVDIRDIAHHLALINRYNGATKWPYSVAQHSVLMSTLGIADSFSLACLLHDTAEAYVSDLIYPHKSRMYFAHPILGFYDTFRCVEKEVYIAILDALGWLKLARISVKQADRAMLAAEIRELMPEERWIYFEGYTQGIPPASVRIEPWTWQYAEKAFLDRFKELIK